MGSWCAAADCTARLFVAPFDFETIGISDIAVVKYFTGFRSGEISALGRPLRDGSPRRALTLGDDFPSQLLERVMPTGLASAEITAMLAAHRAANIVVSQFLRTTGSPC
jgi:hypothetical protein